MSDIVIDIAARHAEDEAAGPFVGRRSEQARLDRGALLAEIERLCEERRSISTLLGKVESLEVDIARLREERMQREALWQACAKHTRLVYGNVFVPKPLPPGTEANG